MLGRSNSHRCRTDSSKDTLRPSHRAGPGSRPRRHKGPGRRRRLGMRSLEGRYEWRNSTSDSTSGHPRSRIASSKPPSRCSLLRTPRRRRSGDSIGSRRRKRGGRCTGRPARARGPWRCIPSEEAQRPRAVPRESGVARRVAGSPRTCPNMDLVNGEGNGPWGLQPVVRAHGCSWTLGGRSVMREECACMHDTRCCHP